MQGLLSILSLNDNDFNKFNNTGAQLLDSIYHVIVYSETQLKGIKVLLTILNLQK